MPFLALFQTGCLIVLAVLLVVAAWQDLRTLHISNSLPLSVVGAFVAWSILGMVAGTLTVEGIALSIGYAAVLFLVAAAGFAAGMIGGGDVKLAAAVALFAGPALMLDFLLVVGVVAVFWESSCWPACRSGRLPMPTGRRRAADFRAGCPMVLPSRPAACGSPLRWLVRSSSPNFFPRSGGGV
ncbi:prepilin peptidase [Reyranella massiliensis]|uniref:prepilin peptidase n=1 Tax=Reyranella massiliensis TaxID=445220 RepID=UPI0006845C7D|nr:prepilin peptidase [Reyranella massiliensis]